MTICVSWSWAFYQRCLVSESVPRERPTEKTNPASADTAEHRMCSTTRRAAENRHQWDEQSSTDCRSRSSPRWTEPKYPNSARAHGHRSGPTEPHRRECAGNAESRVVRMVPIQPLVLAAMSVIVLVAYASHQNRNPGFGRSTRAFRTSCSWPLRRRCDVA